MNLDDQLRSEIKASGRSLLSIAKEAGVGYVVLYRWYHGQRQHLRSDTVGKLMEALGLEVRRK